MTAIIATGFNRRVKLEWFERTAELARNGATRSEIMRELDLYLREQLAVDTTSARSARSKTITILVRTWASPPTELLPLRDDAFVLWDDLSRDDRVVLHWGMAVAVYPFFGLVADQVGRLLQLHGAVAAAQVQRRLAEQMGERNTVARNGRYVLRSFVDWGVLADTAEKGVYRATPPRGIQDTDLLAWLTEAMLISAGGSSVAVRSVATAPRLFPFDPSHISSNVVRGWPRLEVFRQGINEEMFALAYPMPLIEPGGRAAGGREHTLVERRNRIGR